MRINSIFRVAMAVLLILSALLLVSCVDDSGDSLINTTPVGASDGSSTPSSQTGSPVESTIADGTTPAESTAQATANSSTSAPDQTTTLAAQTTAPGVIITPPVPITPSTTSDTTPATPDSSPVESGWTDFS